MSDEEQRLRRDLAVACRVLVANGQGDSVYGHVTARLPGWNRCWMKPAWLGLEEVREEDLIWRAGAARSAFEYHARPAARVAAARKRSGRGRRC